MKFERSLEQDQKSYTSLPLHRRVYWINPAFQIRFIALSYIPVVLTLLAMRWGFNTMNSQMAQYGRDLMVTSEHPFYGVLAEQSRQMDFLLLALAVVMGLVVTIWSIIMSHRIAGPLGRLEKYLDDASTAGQKIPALSFRPHDFFQELPRAFNRFAQTHGLQKKQGE